MAENDSTPERVINGCASAGNVMKELWEITASRLTKKELKWFSGATDVAIFQAEKLAHTVELIGCYLNDDTQPDKTTGNRGGWFAGNEPQLLWSIADAVDCIRGMVYVGGCASDRLVHPELYRSLDLSHERERHV